MDQRDISAPVSPSKQGDRQKLVQSGQGTLKSDHHLDVRMFCSGGGSPYNQSPVLETGNQPSSLVSLGYSGQSMSSIHMSANNSGSSTAEAPKLNRKGSFCSNQITIQPSMLATAVVKRTLSGNWESITRSEKTLSTGDRENLLRPSPELRLLQADKSESRMRTANKLKTIHACSEEKLSLTESCDSHFEAEHSKIAQEFKVPDKTKRKGTASNSEDESRMSSPNCLSRDAEAVLCEQSEDVPRLKVGRYTAPDTHFLK